MIKSRKMDEIIELGVRTKIENKLLYDEKIANKPYLLISDVRSVYYYKATVNKLFKVRNVEDDSIDDKIYLTVMSDAVKDALNGDANVQLIKLIRLPALPKVHSFTLRMELKHREEVLVQNRFSDRWEYAQVIEFIKELRRVEVRLLGDRRICVPFERVAYLIPDRKTKITKAYRVVAKIALNDGQESCSFYAGHIIESAKSTNKFRHLIYFENGTASYVNQRDIAIALEQSSKLKNYNSFQRAFINHYFRKHPFVPLEKFKIGDRCQVRLKLSYSNDESYIRTVGQVTEIDCKLVQLWVPVQRKHIWLFRGDFTRILSINGQERLQINEHQFTKRQRPARNIGDQHSFIEITIEDDEDGSSTQEDDFIEIEPEQPIRQPPPAAKLVPPPPTPEEQESPPSELVVEQFAPHKCSKHCLSAKEHESTYGMNRFVVPFICGWNRLYKIRFDHTKQMFYLSPCGKKLFDIETIFDYLQQTGSILQIDQFNLDSNFVIEEDELPQHKYYVFKDDISNGVEVQPVSMINTIDERCPPAFEYIAEREISPNVKIDFNQNFLVCCNCVDDCRDATNCACQRLTMESASIIHKFDRSPLKNRLLEDKIISGIYECNVGCACMRNRERCVNRIVQLGLRNKLQVFNTYNKGWGVRTLHDIPKGSFICIYSGMVLDDLTANQEGMQFSDTYLADLDLVEHLEQAKLYDNHNQINLERDHGGERSEADRFRLLHGDSELYAINAGLKGNVGRFLNHSCEPNCFAQAVLIDTHDLRFHWIAFFSKSHITAHSELTWDYNYQLIGTKTRIACNCAADRCRLRLL